MYISDIIRQKHNENRFSVYVDGVYCFSLFYEDLLTFALRKGSQIDEALLADIRERVVYVEARKKALHFLAYKARTKKEVLAKLKTFDYTDDICEQVIAFLLQYKYIDDVQFATAYIKEATSLKRHGKVRIMNDLRRKGIAEDLMTALLSETEPSLDNAYALAEKRLRRKTNLDGKEKKRTFDFLVRNGYSFDEAKLVVERFSWGK